MRKRISRVVGHESAKVTSVPVKKSHWLYQHVPSVPDSHVSQQRRHKGHPVSSFFSSFFSSCYVRFPLKITVRLASFKKKPEPVGRLRVERMLWGKQPWEKLKVRPCP
jgi:hypothetical protein